MRPTALTLNIFVATFASYRYAQAGYFRWRVVWPFLLGSLPFAFIGGGIQLPGEYYRAIVGGVLILAGLEDAMGRASLCKARGAATRRSGSACSLGVAYWISFGA